MVESVKIDSEVVFFDSEKIPNDLEIYVYGVKYENLFPLHMAQELVEEFLNTSNLRTSRELAERLIEYRINDA